MNQREALLEIAAEWSGRLGVGLRKWRLRPRPVYELGFRGFSVLLS